jgi:D-tyrosyl-tRNA(Tyr) deacylase
MRLLIQRVARGRVTIAGRTSGAIEAGLVVLAGFAAADDESVMRKMIRKMVDLRIFPDGDGKMNRSVADEQGGLLLVSQFTLYADCRKGRRPSYTSAAPPAEAEALYDSFVSICREEYSAGPVATGEFGAMMMVDLVNDGPVTIWLDSAELGVAPGGPAGSAPKTVPAP